MNTKEIVNAIASQFGLAKEKAKEIAKFTLTLLVGSAEMDGNTRFSDKTFKKKTYKSRKFYVPSTKETREVPERSFVVLKVACSK